jgi:hypothetical protein
MGLSTAAVDAPAAGDDPPADPVPRDMRSARRFLPEREMVAAADAEPPPGAEDSLLLPTAAEAAAAEVRTPTALLSRLTSQTVTPPGDAPWFVSVAGPRSAVSSLS